MQIGQEQGGNSMTLESFLRCVKRYKESKSIEVLGLHLKSTVRRPKHKIWSIHGGQMEHAWL